MGEIHLKFAFDSFYRWVEIAESQIRKLIPNQIHQLLYAHALAGFCHANFSQIPIGINVEIAPLDHFETGLFYKISQGLIFRNTVGHSGKYKIVNGGPASVRI